MLLSDLQNCSDVLAVLIDLLQELKSTSRLMFLIRQEVKVSEMQVTFLRSMKCL